MQVMDTRSTEELKDIFSNVNDWLKFAEAKNAALVGFNAGAVFGAIALLDDQGTSRVVMRSHLFWFCLLNTVALMIGLWSFLPKTGAELWCRVRARLSGNVVYYGHIYSFKEDEYLSKVESLVQGLTYPGESLNRAYADQIIANARIAIRKYRYFVVALGCTLVAIIVLLSGIILNLGRASL